MFTKTLLFVFAFIGFFAILFGTIQGDFYDNQTAFTASAGSNKEVAEYFDLANVTLYANAGSDNMTYPYSSWFDNGKEWAGGLPSGQYLEVWWASEVPPIYTVIEFRHVEDFWGGIRLIDRCSFKTKDKIDIGQFMFKTHLVNNYDAEDNGTTFYASCSHLAVSTIISYNQTKYTNIAQAWDNGELDYVLSYEVDWNATSISGLNILGKLLTFQNPNLGITGIFGTTLNLAIAIPFWVMTTILIIKLVQSVIPFIKGLSEE